MSDLWLAAVEKNGLILAVSNNGHEIRQSEAGPRQTTGYSTIRYLLGAEDGPENLRFADTMEAVTTCLLLDFWQCPRAESASLRLPLSVGIEMGPAITASRGTYHVPGLQNLERLSNTPRQKVPIARLAASGLAKEVRIVRREGDKPSRLALSVHSPDIFRQEARALGRLTRPRSGDQRATELFDLVFASFRGYQPDELAIASVHAAIRASYPEDTPIHFDAPTVVRRPDLAIPYIQIDNTGQSTEITTDPFTD